MYGLNLYAIPTLEHTLREQNMSAQERTLLAVIGDEDSVTGLLLAGIGHVSEDETRNKNFTVVDAKTDLEKIEAAFDQYINRKDIAILLINQHVCRWRLEYHAVLF